jgi:hypothetical protein
MEIAFQAIYDDDVKTVLSCVPQELWARVKEIHFSDDSNGIRNSGYAFTRGRREINLCAYASEHKAERWSKVA